MKATQIFMIAFALVNARVHAIDWKTSSHGIWAMDCDFQENNLKNVPSKGEECSKKCLETSGCTHYSWNNYNGGTCWMKKGQVSKENALNANGVVCGINSKINEIPGNGDNSGGHSSNGAVRFSTVNKCPHTIWIGLMGRSHSNKNWLPPKNGGWELKSGQTVTVEVPKDYYAGRIWGRTGCSWNGGRFNCETGDCGPWVDCANGGVQRGGQTPATLAEFTLNGSGSQDFYDVSLVDGYNLKLSIEIVKPAPGSGNYWCKNPKCNQDLNVICPNELKKYNSQGKVVGCMSACEKFRTDQYCCRGAHNQPHTCRSSDWPFNYPAIFKKACPDAYSYAYDDHTSTFFCRNTDYRIVFC